MSGRMTSIPQTVTAGAQGKLQISSTFSEFRMISKVVESISLGDKVIFVISVSGSASEKIYSFLNNKSDNFMVLTF